MNDSLAAYVQPNWKYDDINMQPALLLTLTVSLLMCRCLVELDII
jgi:hypothetical protein